MSDIMFIVGSRVGGELRGTLTWVQKGLQSNAISGPFGLGGLPSGSYRVIRKHVVECKNNGSYTDRASPPNCWFLPIEAKFVTDRNGMGIHPDGGVVGTEGCIGILDDDTSAWLNAIRSVPANGTLTLEVKYPA